MIRVAVAALVFLSAWMAGAAEPSTAAGGPRPALVQSDAEIVNWNVGVDYTYDGSGNVTVIGNDTLRYDTASRLVQSGVNGIMRVYEYDPFGNRTACKEGVSQIDCQGQAVASATNRLTGQAHQYSASGSLELRTGHSYAYDALDMQTGQQVTGTTPREYIYTADDERIAVYTTSGWWQWTVRDVSGKILRELTSQNSGGSFGTGNWQWTKDYVYRGDKLLASRQIPSNASTVSTYHYHLDHLGSPRRVTNDTDVIVGHSDYYAFGPETPGGLAEASPTRLEYTGHERDVIDGTPEALDYMHARYYDPKVGRFLSMDPTWDSADLARPQSWNRYAYVTNNPFMFVDPDGKLQRDSLGRVIMFRGTFGSAKHAAEPRPATGFDAIIRADDGTDIGAFQRFGGAETLQTNCHGLTFTEGDFMIHDSQAKAVLDGDGYKETGNAQVGDVAIYRGKGGEIVHSMTVAEVSKDGKVLKVAGLGGIEMKSKSVAPSQGWKDGSSPQYYCKESDRRTEEQRKKHVQKIIQYEKPSK